MNLHYMTRCKGQWHVSVFIIREFPLSSFGYWGSFIVWACGLLTEPRFSGWIWLQLKPSFTPRFLRGLCLRQRLALLTLQLLSVLYLVLKRSELLLSPRKFKLTFTLFKQSSFYLLLFSLRLYLIVKFCCLLFLKYSFLKLAPQYICTVLFVVSIL